MGVPLEKWQILGVEQLGLKIHNEPGPSYAETKSSSAQNTKRMRVHQKHTGANLKELPMSKLELFEQQN